MYPAAQSATAVPLFIKDSLMISQRDFPFISRWGNVGLSWCRGGGCATG